MASLEKAASRVATLLLEQRQTVSVAESSAGGLLSAALLAIPGASVYYKVGSLLGDAIIDLLLIVYHYNTGTTVRSGSGH